MPRSLPLARSYIAAHLLIKRIQTHLFCAFFVRSSICESSPRLRVNVIFLRLRLHYSHFANVHGLRVTFWRVLQYVYFICSKIEQRARVLAAHEQNRN